MREPNSARAQWALLVLDGEGRIALPRTVTKDLALLSLAFLFVSAQLFSSFISPLLFSSHFPFLLFSRDLVTLEAGLDHPPADGALE